MLLIWSSDLTPLCSSPLLWCLGLPCWDCRPPSTSWEWGQPWESWTSESLLPTTLHLAGTWWAHCLVWWPSPLDSSFNWCAPSFPTKTCARGRGLCYLCLNNFPDSSVGTKSACNAGDPSSIPGWGRSAGEGKVYPLQYSGLENSMDCMLHGITKIPTCLSSFEHCLWMHSSNLKQQQQQKTLTNLTCDHLII